MDNYEEKNNKETLENETEFVTETTKESSREESASENATGNITPKNKKKNKNSFKKMTGKERFDKAKTIIGVILIIAALLGGFGVISVLKTPETDKNFMVASIREIPKGTLLTTDNWNKYIALVVTNDSNNNAYIFNTEGEAIRAFIGKSGMYSMVEIKKGTIMRRDWMTETSALSDVPDGMQLVSFSVPSTDRFIGFIPKKGDIIKLYGIWGLEGEDIENTIISRDELIDDEFLVDLKFKTQNFEVKEYEFLQYVQIYGLYNGAGIEYNDEMAKLYQTYDATQNNDFKIENVVVLCTEEQAKQIILAQREGNVYCTLVCNNDSEKARMYLEKQQLIIERHNLKKELMQSSVSKYDIQIPLKLFNLDDDEIVPYAGDSIRFSYESEGILKGIDENGDSTEITYTSIVYPEILNCFTIKQVIELDHEVQNESRSAQNIAVVISVSEEQHEMLLDCLAKYSSSIKMEYISEWKEDIEILLAEVEQSVKNYKISEYDNKIAECDKRIKEKEERDQATIGNATVIE